MTADLVNNLILGSGDSAVTVYTELVEEIFTKIVTVVKAPQSSANWESGPKTTKIVDLLRVEYRYNIRGFINSIDTTKLQALFDQGGVFNMTWDGSSFNVNCDKLVITKSPKNGEQDDRKVQITVIKGSDM